MAFFCVSMPLLLLSCQFRIFMVFRGNWQLVNCVLNITHFLKVQISIRKQSIDAVVSPSVSVEELIVIVGFQGLKGRFCQLNSE